jgi:hypothetical protein
VESEDDAGRYFDCYRRSRPYLALEKHCPIEHQTMTQVVFVEIAELGGLHYR